MCNESDEALLARFLGGDRDAFRLLFERHKDRVYNTAFRIVGSSEEAADLLQDVFLVVFRQAAGFQARSRFSTWLTSVAIHASLNRAQRSKRLKPVAEIECPPVPFEPDDPLPQLFAKLDPLLRAVLTLRYVERMD
jgi:RNA polymerase sigma factor (sigma-70 family)